MSINSRLKEFRKSKVLSQRVVAEKLGIKMGAYKTYELGLSKLPIPILQKLMEKFEIDVDWLLTGTKKLANENDINCLKTIVYDVAIYEVKQSLNLTPLQRSNLIAALFRTYLQHGRIDDIDIKNYCSLMLNSNV